MVTTYECPEDGTILPLEFSSKIERNDFGGVICPNPKCRYNFHGQSNAREVTPKRLAQLRAEGWLG